MDTPAFLLWALEYTCTIRGFEDGTNPERVERQLRAARATSDAVREDRVLDGLCLDPPYGFHIAEALELYGGLSAVQAACHGCPANALAQHDERSLAGCFGLVPLPPNVERLYALWMRSPIGAAGAQALHDALANIETDAPIARCIFELRAALTLVIEHDRPLHILHFPSGRVEGPLWRLIPHCPSCKAPWREPACRCCAVCGFEGAAAPDKKRQARGRRPYYPLERLLGSTAAAAVLLKYAAYRAQQESPDPAKSPPLPERPNNPRAD